jgi:HlyD family secretion protein
MNATCEFIINKKEEVVAVPNEALKTDTDGNRYVEVAIGGKQAPAEKDAEADPNLYVGCKIVKHPVEVGLEGNDTTEITGGIKEGDRIITQTIEPSTAAPGGGNPFGGSKGPGKK